MIGFCAFVVVLACSFCVSCAGHNAQSISGPEFRKVLDKSIQNSADSWWIIKQDSISYYFELRHAIRSNELFVVPKADVSIDIDKDAQYPINLKYKNIHFPSK